MLSLSKDVIAIRDFEPNELESGTILKGTYGELRGKMRGNKRKVKFFSGGVIIVCVLGKDIKILDDDESYDDDEEEDF